LYSAPVTVSTVTASLGIGLGLGLGLGLGIAFGELKFGELKRNRASVSDRRTDRQTDIPIVSLASTGLAQQSYADAL